MNSIGIIKDLFTHMAWADSMVWKAALANNDAQSDKALRDRLLHLHLVQHAFLMVWQGAVFNPAGATAFDLAALLDWARTYHLEVHEFLESFDPSRLDEPMAVPWAEYAAAQNGKTLVGTPTLGETMIQVASHSAYHRGQINTRLRELGTEPPMVDYIAWIWFGRPLSEWPREPMGQQA